MATKASVTARSPASKIAPLIAFAVCPLCRPPPPPAFASTAYSGRHVTAVRQSGPTPSAHTRIRHTQSNAAAPRRGKSSSNGNRAWTALIRDISRYAESARHALSPSCGLVSRVQGEPERTPLRLRPRENGPGYSCTAYRDYGLRAEVGFSSWFMRFLASFQTPSIYSGRHQTVGVRAAAADRPAVSQRAG